MICRKNEIASISMRLAIEPAEETFLCLVAPAKDVVCKALSEFNPIITLTGFAGKDEKRPCHEIAVRSQILAPFERVGED